eukprot:6209288-Pleurochrysis_carterae.AAC.5
MSVLISLKPHGPGTSAQPPAVPSLALSFTLFRVVLCFPLSILLLVARPRLRLARLSCALVD